MEAHKNSMQRQVEERTVALEETNNKLFKTNQHIEDLKRDIETQEFSMNEALSMENEYKGISEATERAYALRDERQTKLRELETEFLSSCTLLESAIVDYNTRVADLQLLPDYSSTSVHHKAALNKDMLLSSSTEKVIGVDLAGDVRPTVEKLVNIYEGSVDQNKAAYQDSLDRAVILKESIQTAEGKLKIVQDKVQKNEHALQSEQETHSAKVVVRQREVNTMENNVAARRDPVAMEAQIAACERQFVELEAQRIQQEEDNVNKMIAVQEEIDSSCKLMMEYEEHVRKKLQELDDYWNQKKTHTVSLPEGGS